MTRQARQAGWWHAYSPGRNGSGYVALETEATLVQDYTLGFIPGLLQTTDYARALFLGSGFRRTETQLENQIAMRMFRQQRLTSEEHPLELVAILEESVVRRRVGGAEVMRSQLTHLVTAAGLPTVTIQVLPLDIGAHPGLDGAFTILSFGDIGEPDLAYVEHMIGSIELPKEADVARARLAFDRLRSDALSPTESATLLRRLVEEF